MKLTSHALQKSSKWFRCPFQVMQVASLPSVEMLKPDRSAIFLVSGRSVNLEPPSPQR